MSGSATHRAVSSAVEHCLHTARVTGSIPVPPTKNKKALSRAFAKAKKPAHELAFLLGLAMQDAPKPQSQVCLEEDPSMEGNPPLEAARS